MMNILSFVLQSINEKTVVFFLRSHWYEYILGLLKYYEKPYSYLSHLFFHTDYHLVKTLVLRRSTLVLS